MRLIALFLTLSLIFCTARAWTKNRSQDHNWAAYKAAHGKSYSQGEEDNRRQIWEKHDDFINQHNNETKQGIHTFEVGHNKYSDMSNAEFNRVMNTYRPRNHSSTVRVTVPFLADRALPSSVNWTAAGYVTPIKDQGQCGSCYTFAATGALEGQYFKKNGKLVSFSEQNIIDCDTKNNGCNGGDEYTAGQYMVSNGGIATEATYPYKGVQQTCAYKASKSGTKVSAANLLSPASETTLQNGLATIGPVTIAVDASKSSFQLYKSGVYNEPACATNSPDHAMLAVGYGTLSSSPYYLVKNSWGTSWGQAGYILMARNKGNMCGIANENSYTSV